VAADSLLVTEEARRGRDVILFVDELHNLIGAGSALGQPLDAAKLLKPALFRGELRVIGATTRDEYLRYVQPDAALERRFHPSMSRSSGVRRRQPRPWPSWPPNRRSSFPSWLVKPSSASFVNSSLCIGSTVTTMRTVSPDGKSSTTIVNS